MFFACDKTEEENVEVQKTHLERAKVNTTHQQLWLSKINALLQLQMDSEIRVEIRKLKSEVTSDYSLSNPKILTIADRLARLLTYDDFISLFVKIDPYQGSNIRMSTRPCDLCLDLLATLPESPSGLGEPSALPPCNCNWTCGDAWSSGTTSNCSHTEDGCGFLWLSSCKLRDIL